MTLAALLALGAALCYGISNFAGPRLARDLPLYTVLIAGQLVALAVSAAFVLTELDHGVPSAGEAGVAFLAGAGNALGLLAFYRAASVGPLSIAAPLGSLGALVPVLVGVAQGESLDGAQARGDRARDDRRRARGAPGDAARRRRRRPERPPRRGRLGARVLRRLRHLPRRHGPRRRRRDLLGRRGLARLPARDLRRRGGAGGEPAAGGSARRAARDGARGCCCSAARLLYTAATREGDLSVVAVLGSLFPVVTVGLAFVLLGERLTRVQGLGAAAAMVGSVLLAASR